MILNTILRLHIIWWVTFSALPSVNRLRRKQIALKIFEGDVDFYAEAV